MHRPQKKRFCELSNFQVFYAEIYCDLPKTCAAGITEKELLAAVQYLAIEKPNLWYCGRDSGIKLLEKGFCDQVSLCRPASCNVAKLHSWTSHAWLSIVFVARVKMAADELTYFSTVAADQMVLNTFVIAASTLIKSVNYYIIPNGVCDVYGSRRVVVRRGAGTDCHG